jgi:hypothetical protein
MFQLQILGYLGHASELNYASLYAWDESRE